MAYLSDSYTPNAASRRILERAWQHVQSVPYRATSRWLFYRLLQDGHYSGKADYGSKFLPLLSRVRHNFWGPWRPDSLADDTRTTLPHGGGERDAEEWAKDVSYGIVCQLDHWYRQGLYLEIWFEAAAMRAQFEHYTRGIPITLRPFQGMPSIDYKWQAAKEIEQAASRYSTPVVVLYYGDFDAAGLVIPETSISDVRQWCKVPFDVERVALNAGDGERYGIPENFDKPGTYQWEALTDAAAGELITGAVRRYVDSAVIREVREEAQNVEKAFDSYVRDFGRYWAASLPA